MHDSNLNPSRRAVAGAALWPVMLLLLAGGAQAQGRPSAAPFADLVGSWSGTGTISLASGSNERIRCQAAYALGDDSNNLRSTLRCASDSYKFELNSDVTYQDGAISGAWREASRSLSGRIVGTAKPGDVAARIESPGFSADLALATRGSRQSVSLRSQGTEFSGVTISLAKR